LQTIECNDCRKKLEKGIRRYKSKLIPDYDICEDCLMKNLSPSDKQVILDRINEEKEMQKLK